MKGSLIVVGFFALGCLLGWSGWLPDVGCLPRYAIDMY